MNPVRRILRSALPALVAGVVSVGTLTASLPSAFAHGVVRPASPVILQETGSSLLYPLFNIWAPEFHRAYSRLAVNTASTGSGTGIADAIAGTVELGASDAYLNPSQVSQNPGMLNIPLAISAQVVAYNVPGVTVKHLNLTGPVIAAMYSGIIKNWDDSRIAALNHGVKFPNLPIVPIHRSDGSGDTFIFTQYLSFSTPFWNKQVGFGTSVTFPSVASALGENGNQGMVTTLASTPGGIAYVGISYESSLAQNNLPYAALMNGGHHYVLPTQASILGAVGQMTPKTPASETISLIFAPGPNSYPIINYEYAIVNDHQKSLAMAADVRTFLTWALTKGESSANLNQVNFVPLPKATVILSQKQIAKIK